MHLPGTIIASRKRFLGTLAIFCKSNKCIISNVDYRPGSKLYKFTAPHSATVLFKKVFPTLALNLSFKSLLIGVFLWKSNSNHVRGISNYLKGIIKRYTVIKREISDAGGYKKSGSSFQNSIRYYHYIRV